MAKDHHKSYAKTMKNRKHSNTNIPALTMGKALVVIMTTSCGAFSPTHYQRAHHPRPSDTVLQYRNLHDYEMSSQPPLKHQKGANVIGVKLTNPKHRLIVQQKAPQDEQIVMDEYLEYIEKRYSRMHRPVKSIRSSFVFPIVSTLVFDTPTITNEAFQALGLTGLVSERLRTRLHAPREFRNEHESAVNIFHYFSPKEVENRTSDTVAMATGRLAPHVSLSFGAQFSLLLESLRKVSNAYFTSLKVMSSFFARLVPAILEKGGLRHSLRMMSVASVAMLLMFRPLFKGFMKQA
eukprot:scaffold36478_cov69-Cyclotella_meneghiniana.AAC.13